MQKKPIKYMLLIILISLVFTVSADKPNLTDAQIREIIIKTSINSYPGRCPCPYHAAKNGSRCGGRSAYSKSGGYSVICYPKDITIENINNYRNRLKN